MARIQLGASPGIRYLQSRRLAKGQVRRCEAGCFGPSGRNRETMNKNRIGGVALGCSFVSRRKLANIMKPSDLLNRHRDQVRQIALRHGVANVKVFGSALHGDDTDSSDLDLLVEPTTQTTMFDIGGILRRSG